jgi:hypothetical protein
VKIRQLKVWIQEKIFCSANFFDLLQQDRVKQMHQRQKTREQANLVRETSIRTSFYWRENTGDQIATGAIDKI